MKITLITKNSGKIKAAKQVFDQYDIQVDFTEIEFPEIQADTSLEIARHTAQQASKQLNAPTIREDHSLFINHVHFPGPFMAYMEKKLPVDKLIQILSHATDKTGFFEIATVYAEPNGTTLEYVYQVPVTFKQQIVIPDPRGGWNGIICINDETRALTEYPEEERRDVWNKNYYQIAKVLTKKN